MCFNGEKKISPEISSDEIKKMYVFPCNEKKKKRIFFFYSSNYYNSRVCILDVGTSVVASVWHKIKQHTTVFLSFFFVVVFLSSSLFYKLWERGKCFVLNMCLSFKTTIVSFTNARIFLHSIYICSHISFEFFRKIVWHFVFHLLHFPEYPTYEYTW